MSLENSNLNFLKLETENDAQLIEDLLLEQLDLQSSISPFETTNIDGMLLKSFKSILHIPTYQDLLKNNIEQTKALSKILNSDKNHIVNFINKLLSIDFKGKFIFSYKNLSLITNILIYAFGEIKRYKISTFPEFEAKVRTIDFSKYDFNKLYLKKDYVQKKQRSATEKIVRENKNNSVLLSKFTIKEVEEDWTEIDDNYINYKNKYYAKKREISYIDNSHDNHINSSLLTDDYNYNEEHLYYNLLTNKSFEFTKTSKDDADLPIELIILLYKLKDVKTLIFQIKQANDQIIKMSLFILMNIKWLFLHQIEEIYFDLNDEELQQKLYIEFNNRASELYEEYNLPKHYSYFLSQKSRKNNLWSPEGDILFKKVTNNKGNNLVYSNQFDLKDNTFDNILCNIYNEYGFITNFKYIRPTVYTYNTNKIDEFIKSQSLIEEEDSNVLKRISTLNSTKNEKKPFTANIIPRNNNSSIQFKDKKESTNEKTTTEVIKDFVKNNQSSFQLMSLFYFFLTSFPNVKKFSLLFDFSYSLELKYLFSLYNTIYEKFHFLIFMNNINNLTEANFSFNSLDSIAFENILGVIKKNKNLTSLKMSLFSQEANYSDNILFYLCSEKNMSLNKLFKDQSDYLIKTSGDMERNIVYYILHYNKIIDDFVTNIKNLFNLLKFESLNTLEEIIFRFDIPIPILNSEKYRNILVKFIINLIIALSLQKNKIKTFKILAPELSFDANKMPLIKQFFQELGEFKQKEEKEENKEKKPEKKIPREGSIKDKINFLHNALNKKKAINNNLHSDSSVSRNPDTSKENITINTTLEDITLNLKIYNLPELFNIIHINNHINLKYINLGFLDEITFISFINEYKVNFENLKKLISLKLSLSPSVISYTNLNKYILDFINIDTPNLNEKYLFSNLKIKSETEMNELIDNVYYLAKTPKLVVQIGNDHGNIHLLSKANKKLLDDRDGMYTLRMIMDMDKYIKIRSQNIINCLASFYCKKENRMIICKENPNEIYS